MTIRDLLPDDFACGFPEILSVLAPLSDTAIPEPIALARCYLVFERRWRHGVKTFVCIDDATHRVVGTASVLIEHKYIHGGGRVGHVEDVAVDPEFQNRGIGAKLLEHAVEFCRGRQCYKVILNCAEEMVGYYAARGFVRHGVEMRRDL